MKLLILPFILGWILSAILAFFYENWEDNRKQNIEMRLKNQPQLALSKKQTWQNAQLNVKCVAYRTKRRVDYHPKIQLNHVSELKAAGFIQCLDAQAMKFPLWGILFIHALVALWHMIHVLNYWINQFKTISKQGKESLK